MRWITAVLLALVLLLQYRLWFAEGSLGEQTRLKEQVSSLEGVNRELNERNARLEREVLELQSGLEVVEGQARSELGMVREGEVFYQYVDPDEPPDPDGPPPQIKLPEGVAPTDVQKQP